MSRRYTCAFLVGYNDFDIDRMDDASYAANRISVGPLKVGVVVEAEVASAWAS